MRRWFLALMALLVTAQMSWAGAALCCVAELGGQPRESTLLVVSEQAHATAGADAHPACEAAHCHCHHAGCATPLADSRADVTPHALAPEPVQGVRLKSHIPAGPERPNWLRA